MSRATAALMGFMLGAATITLMQIGRLADLAADAKQRVLAQASYELGRAQPKEGEELSNDANERRADPAAPAL